MKEFSITSFVDINSLPIGMRRAVISDILKKESRRLRDLADRLDDAADDTKAINLRIDSWSVATGFSVNGQDYKLSNDFSIYIK